MYETLVSFLFLLGCSLLVYLFIRNVIYVMELLGIRRSIMKHQPPIVIPFMVFITRPLRDVLKTHMANKTAALQGASLVYGLTLPLQLQAHNASFSSLCVQLRNTTGATGTVNAASPILCSDEQDMIRDANTDDEFGALRQGLTVRDGGEPVRRSICASVKDNTASTLVAPRRRKDILGRWVNRRVRPSVKDGYGSSGTDMGSIKSSKCGNTGDLGIVGNDMLECLMCRPQLSLVFRLETVVRCNASWLNRVDANSPLPDPREKSVFSHTTYEEFLPARVLPPTGTTELHASSVAAGVVGGTNREIAVSSADNPIQLRCVCLIGAYDVEIMRAVTVSTTKTFDSSQLTYQCYYTDVDESNCARERMKFLDWHNRQQLGARFHRGDDEPVSSTRPYSLGDIALQFNDPQSSRQYYNQYQANCYHNMHLSTSNQFRHNRYQGNLLASSEDVPASPLASFDSLSTVVGRTRSFHPGTPSNVITETFHDVSSNFIGGGDGSTQDFVAASEEREKEKHEGDMNKRSQRTARAPPHERQRVQRDNTETTDGEFVTAVSTAAATLTSSFVSSWADSSSTDDSLSTMAGECGKVITGGEGSATSMGLGNSTCVPIQKDEKDEITATATATATTTSTPTAVISPSGEVNWKQEQREAREHDTLELNSPQYVREQSNNNNNSSSCCSSGIGTTALYMAEIPIPPRILRPDIPLPPPLRVDTVDLVLAAIQNPRVDGCTSPARMRVGAAETTGREESFMKGNSKNKRTEYNQQPQDEQDVHKRKKQRHEDVMTHGRLIENRHHPITLAFMLTPQTVQVRRERRLSVGLSKSHPVNCVVCVYSSLVATEEAPGNTSLTARGRRKTVNSISSLWRETDEVMSLREGVESQSMPSVLEETIDSATLRAREKAMGLLGAMHSDAGAEMPMGLQYIRVRNDLYVVRAISDRTFVQYREERIITAPQTSGTGDNNSSVGNSNSMSSNTSHNTNFHHRCMDDSTDGHQNSVGTAPHKRRTSTYRFGGASYSLVSPSQCGVKQRVIRMCWFCLRTPADVIFLPCAHFAVCAGCAGEMQECCICHTPIQVTITLQEQTE